MRKLIISQVISADGFAADENGTTAFFESPRWSAGTDEEMLSMMEGVDAILLGRRTYEMFVQYWPQQTNDTELIADRLNETQKIVFTNTLDSLEWGDWEKPRLVRGKAEDTVRKMKSEPGKDIILWGSLSLCESLLKEGLVDEFHIRTVPMLIGNGRRLFEAGVKRSLELLETASYDSGMFLSRYAVKD